MDFKKCWITALFTLLIMIGGFANNVQVDNLTYDESNRRLNFDLSWENSFHYEDFAEVGILIFAKYKNSNSNQWQHCFWASTGHSENGSQVLISTHGATNLTDKHHLLVKHNSSVNGAVASQDIAVGGKINDDVILIDPSFKVFAIEVVLQNLGDDIVYSVGDGSSSRRFHQGNNENEPFKVIVDQAFPPSIKTGTNADEIEAVGVTLPEFLNINYTQFKPRSGIMRYEISQQQYIDYLNCLSRAAQNEHTQTDISGTSVTAVFVMSGTETPSGRNGIRCDASLPASGPVTFYSDLDDDGIPNETRDGQTVSANFLLPKDLMGYLDWAGLLPMSELQYEFWSRGTDDPIQDEYAWGTTEKTAVSLNIGASGGPTETPVNIGANGLFRRSNSVMRSGATANATTNRVQAGASFFGVMDLTGNAAELVHSFITQEGSGFTFGSDGHVDGLGNQNEDWPTVMALRGYAPGNSTVRSVSYRESANIQTIFRTAISGGRGLVR